MQQSNWLKSTQAKTSTVENTAGDTEIAASKPTPTRSETESISTDQDSQMATAMEPKQDTEKTTTENEQQDDTTLSDLEEGEIYVYRKGQLERIIRTDDEGMRKIRITDEAYQATLEVGMQMRKQLNGYKPDVSLIASALLLQSTQQMEVSQQLVKQFALRMFSQTA